MKADPFMSDISIDKLADSVLPTRFGRFRILAFDSGIPDFPHIVLSNIQSDKNEPVNVRIHSECMTGDVFGSVRCDCGEQLDKALTVFGKEGGVLVYLRQEGRGIGLVNKLKAYNLQDADGMDTIQANLALGFHGDERDYSPGIEILRQMGIDRIRLYTNNPEKIDAFRNTGIEVVERCPVVVQPREENEAYLRTKQDDLGHLLGD